MSSGGHNKRRIMIIETREEFESITDCANVLGIDRGGINAQLRKQIRSYMGMHFKYLDVVQGVRIKEEKNQKESVSRSRGLEKISVMIAETGEIFESIHACARAIGGDVTNISKCLNGVRKTHKGFSFYYVDDEKDDLEEDYYD